MIKHDELLTMWEKDSRIDNVDINKTSQEIPRLHSKYLKILIDAKASKISTGHKIETLKKDLELYYSGQATAQVYKDKPFPTILKTKSAIEQHVNTDPLILGLRDKLEYLDVIIECCEFIMKQIFQMSFVIKNMIEFMRFREGTL